ncbi:MAG: hypothetical protein HN826_15615, partial [Methylococcales bacterium]|nr:hypothetical protein [Methylococcales bacterium]
MKYIVQEGLEGLVKTTGHWSGRDVHFNCEDDTIILLDKSLTANDLKKIIRDEINNHLELSLTNSLTTAMIGQTEKTNVSRLKQRFNFSKASIFRKPHFCRYSNNRHVSALKIYRYLNEKHGDIETIAREMSKLVKEAALNGDNVINDYYIISDLGRLANYWLHKNINTWCKNKTPMHQILKVL